MPTHSAASVVVPLSPACTKQVAQASFKAAQICVHEADSSAQSEVGGRTWYGTQLR